MNRPRIIKYHSLALAIIYSVEIGHLISCLMTTKVSAEMPAVRYKSIVYGFQTERLHRLLPGLAMTSEVLKIPLRKPYLT